MNAGQRFARLATRTTARAPWLWPLFRGPLRGMFDRIAPTWDSGMSAHRLTAYCAGLAAVDEPPLRAVDVGTGTGSGAFELARRWPDAEVLGVDLSPQMVAEARAKTPPELAGRVRFEPADATALPLEDASQDLVALNNMIPFPAELARVTRPGGHVVVAFSQGPRTPIHVPQERLRAELERAGFEDVRRLAADPGEATVARRGPRVP